MAPAVVRECAKVPRDFRPGGAIAQVDPCLVLDVKPLLRPFDELPQMTHVHAKPFGVHDWIVLNDFETRLAGILGGFRKEEKGI